MRIAMLTGEWRDLAVLTWTAAPERLAGLAPSGTTLDLWEGRACLSVVGLRFLHLHAAGVPVPGLQGFAQVNVRTYVRRRVAGEVRHGARFLVEMAPTPLLAAAARLALHEPWIARDTRVQDVARADGQRSVTYAWRGADWHHLRVLVGGPTQPEAGQGTLETFLLQRCWGYAPQPDGSTLEYQVEHPRWRLWPVRQAHLEAEWGDTVIPPDVAGLLAHPPDLALFAEGSAMQMHRPHRLLPQVGRA